MGNTIAPETVITPGDTDAIDVLLDPSRTDAVVICSSGTYVGSTPLGKAASVRFGNTDYLVKQGKQPGECFPIQIGNRYVYYLIVSKDETKRATVLNLQNAMQAMVTHATLNNVTTLTFETKPPPGIQITPYIETVTNNAGNLTVQWFDTSL